MAIDYYKILGVDISAGAAEIKRAYRALAVKYHPDKNPDCQASEESFKLLTEAYEVLKDGRKRAEYDRSIESKSVNDLKADAARAAKAARESVFIPNDELLADFLKGFYSRKSGDTKKKRTGEDLRYNLKVSFEEACLGAEKVIMIPFVGECSQCSGTGAQAGARALRCRECRGVGKVRNDWGRYEICSSCKGSGRMITAFCKRCKGSGRMESRRKIQVHVPPGIGTGTRLKLTGVGQKGKAGGGPGDMYVVVHVDRHPFLEKQGNDLVCSVPVPFLKAASGCTIEVPTLTGVKSVKVPAGASSGKQIRIRGQGIRFGMDGKRGDLIAYVQVELPQKLTAEEKKLIRRLEKASKPEAYPATLKFNIRVGKLKNNRRA